MLCSVCSYSTFPFADDTGEEVQSIFLLNLYSCVRKYELQTGKGVLPALLPIFQSAPSVWVTDLSQDLTFLHQTLKLQAMKKPIELRGWTNKAVTRALALWNFSDDKRNWENFLQCLSFVSQLR